MDGKGKMEGVTHQLSITKPRPESDTCAASRSLRVLYHDQAAPPCSFMPHTVTCAGAKDGLGSTRTRAWEKPCGPRCHLLRMLKLRDMLAYFMSWGRGRRHTQVSTNR